MRIASTKSRLFFSGLATVTTAALLTLGFSAGAAQAVTASAELDLTVQGFAGQVPVSNAFIELYEDFGGGDIEQARGDSTSTSGRAEFTGLDVSQKYYVYIEVSGSDTGTTTGASGWLNSDGSTAPTWEASTGVTTPSKNAMSVTATLDAGNTVHGNVLSSNGSVFQDADLPNFEVDAYQKVTDIETGATGLAYRGSVDATNDTTVAPDPGDVSYSFPGLSNGDYVFKLEDGDSDSDGTAPSTWNAGSDLAKGGRNLVTPTTIDATHTTQSVERAAGETITGHVNGDPEIAGDDVSIGVVAYPRNPDGTVDEAGSGDYSGFIDGAEGDYSITVPAGDYFVQFNPGGTNDFSEWYDAAATPATATTVTAPQSDVDATLSDGFTLTGVVKAGTVPLAGVKVKAIGVGGQSQQTIAPVTTDANGSYTFTGLAPDEYNVEFDGTTVGYGDVFYDGTSNGTTDGDQAGTISAVTGTQTADQTYAAISTLTVHLTTKSGAAATGINADAIPVIDGVPDWNDYSGIVGGHAVKGKAGTFTIPGLTEGTKYTLHIYSTSSSGNVYDQYLGGTPSDFGSDLATANSADLQTFTLSTATDVLNATVATAPAISGTVTSTSGSKLKGVFVSLYRYVGKSWLFYDLSATSSSGAYKFPTEPSGSYKLAFSTSGGKYVSSWYGGSTLDGATPIYLTATTAKTASVKLVTGGTISGTLHTSTNAVAHSYSVTAYPLVGTAGNFTDVGDPIFGSTLSSSKGAFSITGLASGSYALSFQAQAGDGTTAVAGDPYDPSNLNSNTVYAVTAGKTKAAGTVVLPAADAAPQGSVSGEVTGGPTSFDNSSSVTFTSLSNFETTETGIASDGSFSADLQPGKYTWVATMRDADSGAGFETESGSVTVTNGHDTSIQVVTQPAAPLAFQNTPAVTVSVVGGGEPAVGTGVLQVSAPTNHASTATVSYQWLRNGHPIYGAQDDTYAIRGVDFGTQLSVRVAVQDDPNATYNFGSGTVVVTQDAPDVETAIAPLEAGTASISPSSASVYGTTLTAKASGWSQPNVAYTYSWFRGADPISGATSRTYKTTTADIGQSISVKITGDKAGYGSDNVTSDTVTVLGSAAPKVTKAPKVTAKTVSDGVGYSVTTGSWSVKSLQYSYQWYSDGAAIDGATSAVLLPIDPTRIDVVTVKVTASKTNYQSGSTTVLARKGTITNAGDNPAPTVTDGNAPVASDTPVHVGEILTANVPVAWQYPLASTPTKYTYKWERNGVAISKATKSTYTVAKSDLTHSLTLVVTVSAPYYNALALAPVAAGSATAGSVTSVGGIVKITHSGSSVLAGTKLTGSYSGYPSGTKVKYHWQEYVDGSTIQPSLGTKSTYVVPSSEVGHQLVFVVTPTLGSTPSQPDFSQPVTVSLAGPIPSLQTIASPTITGSSVTDATSPVGKTLTADPGQWSATSLSYSYQWTRNGIDIPGATSSTFVPNGDALGDDITVKVTAKKSGYVSGADESDAIKVTEGAAPKASTVPKITGTVKDGSTLSATTGVWPLDGLTFSFQWLNNGEDIPGATGSTYVVDAVQLGAFTGADDPTHTLSVRVTATRTGYNDGSATSSSTVKVPLVTRDIP